MTHDACLGRAAAQGHRYFATQDVAGNGIGRCDTAGADNLAALQPQP